MTYQVLARKLRPRTFDEVIGQAHVTTPLRNAIRTDRVPHAILLTGPRGTGKTTLARILACCLNAEKGPTDAPDPDDPSCLEIAAGRSTDVQEIDAASRTSVDDVRELIEAVRYAPSPGKHRIYIVDEVHMLSTAAFNALLKTLEEPPPHSLFVFCTTNPEKIPFTVVSRCQRYDLRLIGTGEIAAYLREIAGSESIEISDASLQAIARAGAGSMRDALTLFDQLLSFGGDAVDDAQVAQVLDLIDASLVRAIAEACVEGDAAAALRAARHAFDQGIDAKRLGGELLQTLRDLVVLCVAPGEAGLVEAADADLEALRAVAGQADEARLRRMFRALLREQEDLAWAPEPFAVLEMAIVRLSSLPAGDDVATLLGRIDALEQRLRGEGGGSAGGSGGSAGASGRGGRASPAPRGKAGSRQSSAAEDTSASAPAAPPPHQRAAEPPGIEPPAAAPTSAPALSTREPEAERSPQSAAREPEPSPQSAAREPEPTREPPGPEPTPRRVATEPANAPAPHRPPDEPTRRPVAPEPAAEPIRAAPREEEPPLPEPPPELADERAGDAGPPTGAPPQGAPLGVVWDRLYAFARAEDRVLFSALQGGELRERTDERLRIALPTGIATRRMEGRRQALEAVCERLFGHPMKVELEAHGAGRAPEKRGGAPDKKAADLRARREALQHPAINTALEILNAEILEIRPLGGRAREESP